MFWSLRGEGIFISGLQMNSLSFGQNCYSSSSIHLKKKKRFLGSCPQTRPYSRPRAVKIKPSHPWLKSHLGLLSCLLALFFFLSLFFSNLWNRILHLLMSSLIFFFHPSNVALPNPRIGWPHSFLGDGVMGILVLLNTHKLILKKTIPLTYFYNHHTQRLSNLSFLTFSG